MCPPTPLDAGPRATAGRGSAAGYQLGYFHNGCLKLGGGGGSRQPQPPALQTRTCSTRGVCGLESEPGHPPRGTQLPPTAHPPDQVKGGLGPCPSLPLVSSFLLFGWTWGGVCFWGDGTDTTVVPPLPAGGRALRQSPEAGGKGKGAADPSLLP